MSDLLEEPSKVYYWPEKDNFLIINPPTMFMFATVEGSSLRKLCIVIDDYIKEYDLVYMGEL